MEMNPYLKSFGLEAAKQDKIASLEDKKFNLTGILDADTLNVQGLGGVRLATDNGQRYDAIETQKQGIEYLDGKSDYAKEKQVEATARFLNKPINEVTKQDMIGYSNWQTAKQAANLVGQTDWEPTFAPSNESLNLSGNYTNEHGNPVHIPLNLPVTLRELGRDKYDRPLASVIAPDGTNQTNIVANDPRQNAFARTHVPITLSEFGSFGIETVPAYDFGNTLAAAGSGAIKLTGNVGDALATFAVTGLDKIATEMGHPDFVSDESVKRVSSAFDNLKVNADKMAGYDPSYSQNKIEQSLQNFEKGNIFSGIVNMFQAGPDVAAESLPYMIALTSGWGTAAVIAGEVNESIDTRKKNNNGRDLSAEELAKIVTLDTAKVMLERLPWMAAVKGQSVSVEGIKKLLNSVPTSQKRAFGKELAKKLGVVSMNVAEESAQESIQYAIDYLNREYGTDKDKGFNLREMQKAAIAGGGAGGTMGAVGQVGKVRDFVKASKEAKIESTLSDEYKEEIRPRQEQTIKQATQQGSLTKQALVETEKGILEAEAAGDTTTAERFRKQKEEAVHTIEAEPIKLENIEVLGNEQDTVDYINQILTDVKDINSKQLRKNIEAIAEKNGLDKNSVDNIYKDHLSVERDVTVGPSGYKTYDRLLRELKNEEQPNERLIATVTNKLLNLQQTQERKLGAIESAIQEVNASINDGTMTKKYVDVAGTRGLTGKPFRIHIVEDAKGNKSIHPSTNITLEGARRTVSAINDILKAHGILRDIPSVDIDVVSDNVSTANGATPTATPTVSPTTNEVSPTVDKKTVSKKTPVTGSPTASPIAKETPIKVTPTITKETPVTAAPTSTPITQEVASTTPEKAVAKKNDTAVTETAIEEVDSKSNEQDKEEVVSDTVPTEAKPSRVTYSDVLKVIREGYSSDDKRKITQANYLVNNLKKYGKKVREDIRDKVVSAIGKDSKLKASTRSAFDITTVARILGKDSSTTKILKGIKNNIAKSFDAVIDMQYIDRHLDTGHILLEVKDNPELMDRVYEGMTKAYVEFVAINLSSLNYIEEKDAQGILGVGDNIYINPRVLYTMGEYGKGRRATANALGADIVKYAGLSIDKETVPVKQKADMEAVLGAILLDIMEHRGLIEIKEIPVNVLTSIYEQIGLDKEVQGGIKTVSIKDGIDVNAKVAPARNILNELKEISPLLQDPGKGVRLYKLDKADIEIRRREELVDVSEEKQAKLTELSNQAYRFNTGVIDALDAMHKAGVLEGILGKAKEDGVRPDTAKANKSSNDKIKRSIMALLDTYKQLGKSRTFYFNYFLSSNGRNFIDSNSINPQNDKLHRFAVNRVGDSVKIDTPEKRTVFKLAVVQAFDGGAETIEMEDGTKVKDLGSIDKQSVEKSIEQFNRVIKRKDVVAAMEAVKNKDWVNNDLVSFISKTDNPAHALMALIELQKYKEDKPFITHLTLEADAVTSGVILGLLSMPVLDWTTLQKYLSLGGVWLGGTDSASFGEFIETTNDIYKTGAVKIDENIEPSMKELLSWIVPVLSENGQATKDGRKFMKSPLMVFNYGAGDKSIKNAIARDILDNYLDKLDSANGDVQVWKEFWDNYDKTINTMLNVETKKEKPNRFIINKLNRAKAVNKRAVWKALRTDSIVSNKELRTMYDGLSLVIQSVYGEATINYLNQEFSTVVAARKGLNRVYELVGQKFASKYNNAYNKGATQKELDAIIEKAKENGFFPVIELGQDKAVIINRETVGELQKGIQYTAKKGGKSHRTIKPLYRTWAGAHTSAGVNFVHWTDGKIISNNTKGLGIHDAKVLGIGYAIDTVKDYQRATWTNTVMAGNPLKQALELFQKSGIALVDDNDIELIETLKNLSELLDVNKEQMQAMGADIEHMSLPGSKVNIKGNGEVLGNEATLPDFTTNEGIANFFKKELGPTLAVNHNNTSKKTNFYTIEDVIVNKLGEEITIKTESGQWTFFNGQAQSRRAISGKKGFVTALDVKYVYDRMKYMMRLGNEPELSEIPVIGLEAQALTSTKGIVDLFDKLVQIGNDVNTKHTNHLRALLNSLDTKFLGKMKVFIDTKAKRNQGHLQVDARTINIAVNQGPKVTSEMSIAEVYSHEIIHAFTAYAEASTNLEAQRIRSKIRAIQEQAKKRIPKDALPANIWKYIFEGENSLREFIAYATTNEQVIKELSKLQLKESGKELTFLDKVLDLLRQLLDIVTFRGNPIKAGDTMAEAMVGLTFQLMEYNNKAVQKIEERKGAVRFMLSLLESSDSKLKEQLDKIIAKMAKEGTKPPTLPKNASKLELAKWYVEFLPQLLTRNDMKPYWKSMLSAFGMKPEGLVQNIIRDISNPDELERTVEKLGMMSDIIDQKARSMESTVAEALQRKFKRKLTTTEKEILTETILDIDIQSIADQYSLSEIGELFSNTDKLDSEISKVQAKLKGEHYNWYVHGANGLANYMLTGYAGITQSLNAFNIATGVLTGEKIEASQETIKAIDTLATLIAMKDSKSSSKSVIADMIAKEAEGVSYLIELHKMALEEARQKLFRNEVLMVKGYSKEVFDNTISVVVKPLADRKDMEAQGYFLVKPLTKSRLHMSKLPMGIYKSKNHMNISYYRAATRLTGMVKRGTSVTDIAFMNEENQKLELLLANATKQAMDKYRLEEVARIKAGKPMLSEDIISPVLDEYGNIVDYRYMMGKAEKKELLVQDTRADKVIARTFGSIIDKTESKTHNRAVMDVILQDMKENYIPDSQYGKNKLEYIKIEKDSNNEAVKEIYRLLPDEFKYKMKEMKLSYIAVRRDMLLNYFGFRNSSLTNAAIGGMQLMTNGQVKSVVRGIEAIWQEFIKIAKVNIVIRIPTVLMGNIMSNIMVSVVEGKNPVSVVRMQLENTRWLRQYLNDEEEYRQAQLAKNTGEMNRLRRELERNPVHELMEAGMYQPIIEDIGKADFESSNRVSRWVDKKMEGLPTFIKNGAHWLYLTEKTSFFRFMTQATQYSDFVARATQNQIMKEKGISKDVRMNIVLDAFVNYNKPATSIEEWFNQMGFLMFTKYAKRIQRAINRQLKDHPLKALLYIAGQEYLGVDTEDIYDQSLFTRSWYNIGLSPLDHVIQVASPASIDIITGGQLSSPIKFH